MRGRRKERWSAITEYASIEREREREREREGLGLKKIYGLGLKIGLQK